MKTSHTKWREVNLVERAYIAGIFDGEGHVCIQKVNPRASTWSPSYHLEVGITNTDKELIRHLLNHYGGYAGRTGVRDGHRMDAYRWRLSSEPSNGFLRMILPYLRIKKRQAEIVLAFQEAVSNRPKGLPLKKSDLSEREAFRLALKASRTNKSTAIPGSTYSRSPVRR